MKKHSPKPWHWWNSKDGRPKKYDLAELRDGNGETVLTLYGDSGVDALGKNASDRSNARLIASAPELLALAVRVANLNPDCAEIGAGMIEQLVAEARRITE